MYVIIYSMPVSLAIFAIIFTLGRTSCTPALCRGTSSRAGLWYGCPTLSCIRRCPWSTRCSTGKFVYLEDTVQTIVDAVVELNWKGLICEMTDGSICPICYITRHRAVALERPFWSFMTCSQLTNRPYYLTRSRIFQGILQ